MDVRIAVSFHNTRISPVFDVSRKVLILDISNGTVVSRREEQLDDNLDLKIEKLVKEGIGIILCGSLSHPVAGMLLMRNIRIAAFLTGDVDAVVKAFIAGNLDQPRFFMPGCCGRRRHRFGWFDAGVPEMRSIGELPGGAGRKWRKGP